MKIKTRINVFDAALIPEIKRFAGSHPAFYARAKSYLEAAGIKTLNRYYQIIAGDRARPEEVEAIELALDRLYRAPRRVLEEVGARLGNAPEVALTAAEYAVLFEALLDLPESHAIY